MTKNRTKVLKNPYPIFQITPRHGNSKILSPGRPPRVPRWPEIKVRVIIWDILMHVNFSYNFWEFLEFFPELCDFRGPLGGPQGPRGGPPKGGTPDGCPPAINWIIYVSGISQSSYVGIISPKTGTDRALGGTLEAPPGVPGSHRVLEKISKILKNYMKNLLSSKYPKL